MQVSEITQQHSYADVQNTILLGGHRSGPVNSDVSRVNITAILHVQWAMAHCRISASYATVALGYNVKLISNVSWDKTCEW